MTAQLNIQPDRINFGEFERAFDRSLGQCLSSRLEELLKGKKIIFSSEDKNLIPVDGWGLRNIPYCITTVTTIQPKTDNTTICAMDSSTIQLAETEDGSLYGVKSGVVLSVGANALIHFKIGPILFYLSEETIGHSQLDHRLAKLILIDSDFAKRLIRIRVERVIQMELSSNFSKSVILIDGSLKSSLFEEKKQGIKNVAENCILRKNSMIGISKSSKLRIIDRISTPLAKIQGPAYMDVNLIIRSLVRNTVGDNLIAKFGTHNSPILRVDVVSGNSDKDEALGKLLGNDSIACGYPETLRLAHHVSTFSSTEISCLRSHVLSNYDVTELASEDIRKTLLGSITV
jgi:NurA domain